MRTTFFLLAISFASFVRADFDPIPLTPSSYNADVVVEKTAPGPIGRSTRASMDGGTNNSGASWYEVGFNTTAPTTGIPAAGSTFIHQTFADHSYAMAPSYTGSNALLVGVPSGFVTNGTFTLAVPAPYSSLSVLASAGGAGAAGLTLGYTVHYSDSTSESGSIVVGDWFNGANPAWNANGRVTVTSHVTDNVNAGNPRLYNNDITLGNTTANVTSIDFFYGSGNGRASIMALSGASVATGPWAPIAVTGYNYDMVVEATAPQPTALTTATTASMDGGTANTGNTWFERGYDPFNTNSGLPAPGSVITSLALPDHHYLMPASYSAPNAIYVDSTVTTANVTLASPQNYSALSFLNATANGAVTCQAIMQYADGTSETNTFIAKDWFNGTPFAYNAQGRVNLNNKSLNNINANNPRLYEAEFVLGNNVSPITNVVLKWIAGGATSRAVILAVSATAGALKPIYSLQPQPVNVFEGGNAAFNAAISGGTQPISYQWQIGTNGNFINLVNGGNISGANSTNLLISSAGLTNVADYRLIAANSAGGATSLVANLTVLSTLPDVTSPSDVLTEFGGTAPTGEEVAHVIDNTTSKYLNFGSGPSANNPPFVGPVGFVVTPAMGLTVVKGIRIYTANDSVPRDPADYKLEGSNDGGTSYSTIASGPLALPDGRNNGGIAIDPLTQFLQQILFTNTTAYTSYRVTFTNVKDSVTANSMQVGEVELLGTQVARLTIAPVNSFGETQITSTMSGTLQSTTVLSEPTSVWTDEGPITAGTPFTVAVDPGTRLKVYRLKVP